MTTKIDAQEITSQLNLRDGTRIVLLYRAEKKDRYSLQELNRNVFRLGGNDQIIWQIKSDFDAKGGRFTGIEYREGKVTAYRWDGYRYEIDLETGNARPLRLEK